MTTEYSIPSKTIVAYMPAGSEVYAGEHTTLAYNSLLITGPDGEGIVIERVGRPEEVAAWLRSKADLIDGGAPARDTRPNEYADTALADLVDGNEAIEDEREARAMFSAGSAIAMGLLAVADELRTLHGRNQSEQEEPHPGVGPATEGGTR
ncbi:hypothetical protein [Zhihengliuella halotolerans]|uniref:hypothetical protein n=1 Tax=Zhihengliuella halotolerans TaxID=370736 RepID=UPI000C808857|nr:hypothetical protein [Zhihengliuella halotolerans]